MSIVKVELVGKNAQFFSHFVMIISFVGKISKRIITSNSEKINPLAAQNLRFFFDIFGQFFGSKN